jgi:predicted P-loop ATPase
MYWVAQAEDPQTGASGSIYTKADSAEEAVDNFQSATDGGYVEVNLDTIQPYEYQPPAKYLV